jgi:hypothetical protein
MPEQTMLDRTPRMHTLVLPVNGSKVRLNVGDRLEIQMRQMFGSGAEWSLADTPDGVSLERDDHFRFGSRGGGAFSTRLFRFRAEARASGPIRLQIGRWGGNDVLGHVDVHVTVG